MSPLFNTCELCDWISGTCGILLMVTFVAYLAYVQLRQEHPTYDDEDYENEGPVQMVKPLQDLKLTKDELKEYDCQNAESTYLVALLGIIYDVSAAPQDFGPSGKYKLLPGTDIMGYIKDTARFLSNDFESDLNEWKAKLEDHFYAAGVLITNEKCDSDSDGNLFNFGIEDDEYKNMNIIEFGLGDGTILDSLINDVQDADCTLLGPVDDAVGDHICAAGVLTTNEKCDSDFDGNLFNFGIEDDEYKDVNKYEFDLGDTTILDSLINDVQVVDDTLLGPVDDAVGDHICEKCDSDSDGNIFNFGTDDDEYKDVNKYEFDQGDATF